MAFISATRFTLRACSSRSPFESPKVPPPPRAAESLREIYVDNADLLDEVTSDTVEPILELIRKQGRKGRYIDFLMVLCECDGKAVRPNQWTISDLIFSPKNKPLFLQLELTDGEILINGHEEYFPTFIGRKEPMKLIEWLVADPPSGADKVGEADHREVRRYFTKTIALYEKLCFGRCEKTTRILRELLSYELVEAVIMSDALHGSEQEKTSDDSCARVRHPHMLLCASFVAIARSLWVDSYTFVAATTGGQPPLETTEAVSHEVMRRGLGV